MITVEDVRAYIRDTVQDNHLLDSEESSDFQLKLAMDLAIAEYNAITPMSSVNVGTFPNDSLLMTGTLWKLYTGLAAKAARNHFSYSDGGIQVPLEERYPFYNEMSASLGASFMQTATNIKTQLNTESGWGFVSSDEATFPRW